MKSYQLCVPTKIYFGRDIWKEALAEQKSLLQGNVLIVTTGRSLIRLGYVEALKGQIECCDAVHKVFLYDKVSANPRLLEIREGIRLCKEQNIDVIVGFGGGSGIDAAKGIAAGAGNGEEIEAFFYEGKAPGTMTLPVIAMPTTAGSGSELSKAAIITDDEKKAKNGIRGENLYPQAAIVDSLFTESVPLKTTMETGFDVFAHGIESYLSKAASPYTLMQSEYAITTVGKYLPRLSEDLSDREAREKMSFASMIMGINLGNASTCLPHRLQYPIGAHTDTSHGVGLAALYPAWVKYVYRYAPDLTQRAISLLTGRDVKGEENCVTAIKDFLKKLRLPSSLRELGIEEADLSVFTSEVTGNIGNDPASVEKHIITELYEAAWEGEK